MAKGGAKNLTKAASLNAASSVFNYVVFVLVGFVTNPILLTWLGSNLFGIWKICQRLLTYVSAADGRATQALKWTIANKQSLDDVAEKQRDVGCAIVVWLRFLPLILVTGSLLTWFSPHFIRGLLPEYYTVTRLTCGILVFNLVISPLRTIPEALLIGMNLGYRCTWIHSIGAVTGGILMVTTAYLGWGLVGLATAVFVAGVVRGVVILVVAKKNLSWFKANRPEKQEVKQFLGFSIWIFSWTFINKLMISGDIIILGLVSSAQMVTFYALTSYSMQIAISLSAMLVSAAVPGLGGIVGRGDFAKATKVRAEIMTFSWIITAIVGSLILLWNFSFVKLWVGPGNFVGFAENLLLVVMTTQLIFIRNDAQIVDVSLKIKNKVLLGGVSTIIAFALAFWLGNFMVSPIFGITLGLIAGRMILTLSYPVLVRRIFQNSEERKVANMARPLLAMITMYGAAAVISSQLEIDNWWQLIGYGSASLLPLAVLAFFLGLSKSRRDLVVARISQAGLSRFPRLKLRSRNIETSIESCQGPTVKDKI